MPDVHTDLTYHPLLGHAVGCAALKEHRPEQARSIWHHIQPQVCGGKTTVANTVALCDNCHYIIHLLLWRLANNFPVDRRKWRGQLAYAQQGYDACVAAGTVGLIPNEGGSYT